MLLMRLIGQESGLRLDTTRHINTYIHINCIKNATRKERLNREKGVNKENNKKGKTKVRNKFKDGSKENKKQGKKDK